MSTQRLAPGVALVSVPGGGLAVRTPEGEFLRVDAGGMGEEALVAALGDSRGANGLGAEAPEPRDEPSGGSELDALTDAFAEAGYLDRTAAPPAGALAGRRVLLLGDPVLVEPLARCVRAEGGDPQLLDPRRLDPERIAVDAAPDGRRTAVVWCLDSAVPPGLWDEADRLPSYDIAWLRCHREGAQVWVEPLAAAPGDVTAAHVRLRRLAATPAHRELAAYWAGPSAEAEGPAHTPASAGIVAGLLTADLIAWASAPAPGPRARRLRRLFLPDLALTSHPVLPVPPVDRAPAAPVNDGAARKAVPAGGRP